MTTFLSASFAAGALILLTAMVRHFAGHRLPRRMYIALWDITVLRLLIPVGLPRWGWQSISLPPMSAARVRLRNPCRTTTRDARRFCKRIRSAAACRSA